MKELIEKLQRLGATRTLSCLEKQEIEKLYFDVLDKKFVRTSCGDCYRDAAIEMVCYLKKHGKMKEKRLYGLKAGIVLQEEFGSSRFVTNANLTDEFAEKYLSENPQNINYFSKYPEDWKIRIEKSKAQKTINTTTNESKRFAKKEQQKV